jgi:peptidoglycan hydrolase-like protein with peptidoglycan-binding domain
MSGNNVSAPPTFDASQAIAARQNEHSVGGARITRAEASQFLVEARMGGVSDTDAHQALRAAGFTDIRGAERGMRTQVGNVERAMIDAGFLAPGTRIDGLMDADTEAAVRAFQHLRGLPETGRPDPETLREIHYDTAEAQSLLTALGHDPQGVDQIMGPNTRGAIRAFQEAQRPPLEATGTLNPETRAAMANARTELINWGEQQALRDRAREPAISDEMLAWAKRDPDGFRARATELNQDPSMIARAVRIGRLETSVDLARNGIQGSGDTLAAVEYMGTMRQATTFGILGALQNNPPLASGFGQTPTPDMGF